MSGLFALPWSLIYLIRVSLALEIGFPKTPPICHWSEKQIVPPQTHAIGGADVSILSWSGCSKKLSNCWIQNHILSCYSFYHLSMAEIVWVVRRYVVPNSANVLMGESIFTLKKRHTLALNTSLQNHWSLLKKKKKKKTGPRPEFSYWFCCAVEFTSRFTNKCQGRKCCGTSQH